MNKVRLGDVCTIQSGGTPSRSKKEYWDGSIPWMKISDLNSKYIYSSDEFISVDGLKNSSAKIFPENTILFTIFATLGEVAILKISAATNQAIAGLKINDDSQLDIDYLYYFLLSLKSYVDSVGRGVAQNNINMSILKSIEIPVPSIETQRKTAYKLDEVNHLIDSCNNTLNKLDELVKSRFVEMFGDLKLNSKGWEIFSFAELSEIITDGEHATPNRTTEGIYLLSARNVLNHAIQLDDVDYISQEEYDRISRRIIPQAGDVLISCSGSVGRCCSVPEGLKFQMVRSTALIRFKKMILPIFAEYMITSDFVQEQIESSKTISSQANLFQGKIAKLKGFAPPVELQKTFITFVKQTDKSKLAVQKSIEKLEILKKSLMQEYFG